MDNIPQLFYGARRTCLEMMRDRKYSIPPTLFNVTESEFSAEFNESGRIMISGIVDTSGNSVFIEMTTETDKKTMFRNIHSHIANKCHDKISGDNYENVISNAEGVRVIIIFNRRTVTGNFAKLINDYMNHSFIEVFDVNRIFINPSKHVYQPQWRLMNEVEINDMLRRYETKSANPTRILLSSVCIDDPMNRYFGGKPPSNGKGGDVYEIIRDGISVCYRRVVQKRMNIE